jgi:hypothetical protein
MISEQLENKLDLESVLNVSLWLPIWYSQRRKETYSWLIPF